MPFQVSRPDDLGRQARIVSIASLSDPDDPELSTVKACLWMTMVRGGRTRAERLRRLAPLIIVGLSPMLILAALMPLTLSVVHRPTLVITLMVLPGLLGTVLGGLVGPCINRLRWPQRRRLALALGRCAACMYDLRPLVAPQNLDAIRVPAANTQTTCPECQAAWRTESIGTLRLMAWVKDRQTTRAAANATGAQHADNPTGPPLGFAHAYASDALGRFVPLPKPTAMLARLASPHGPLADRTRRAAANFAVADRRNMVASLAVCTLVAVGVHWGLTWLSPPLAGATGWAAIKDAIFAFAFPGIIAASGTILVIYGIGTGRPRAIVRHLLAENLCPCCGHDLSLRASASSPDPAATGPTDVCPGCGAGW